ncbi:MAG TPA: polysaccharide deacetylase family protein [Clostridia bacterium]|nr:polysaccharide deacetylase family protein [Clostridia bacterium]
MPILMYHKLGPRPRGVRQKGLYVSTELFSRQMAELRAAGFAPLPLSDLAMAKRNPHPIVITFDDGCENVLRHGTACLRDNGFYALQFLVAHRLGQTNDWDAAAGEVAERLMNPSQVREWLAAGNEIGSHTLTHPWLTRLSLAQAREEIVASKRSLEDTFGMPIRHFCYPYGNMNQAVRDLVAEAGYTTACTTEPGMNTSETDPFRLKRFTARYPSRNLKAMWTRWRAALFPQAVPAG